MYHAGDESDRAGNDAAGNEAAGKSAVGTLRVLTINLGLLGLAVRNRWRVPVDSYIKERVAAAPLLLSAQHADVIALQEVYRPADRELLTDALAPRYPFFAGSPQTNSFVGNGLMLLSRFPILRSVFMPTEGAPLWTLPFFRPGLLAADLDLPSIGPTRLINAHIASSLPFSRAASLASTANRDREISQLLSAAGGREPAAILVGDFNASPEIHPTSYRRIIDAGYLDAFVASNPPSRVRGEFTWDAANPLNGRGRFRDAPSQRIDHVFLPNVGSPSPMPESARIVLRESTIPTASGRQIPLSDHYGLLVTLSLSRRRSVLRSKA